MIEKIGKYPVYTEEDKKLLEHKALVSLNYEQLMEIANIFYHVNKKIASMPRLFGGLRFDERKRSLHKSIHDACVNCVMSLAEAAKYDQKGVNES